jgi:DNA-binding winged helix-turn-helix (wHTH) protein/Flp pilus assembly protein TadD
MATKQPPCIYEFGPFRVDAVKRLLLREDQTVQLTPKCFDILLALVESSGEIIDKDELMKRVWPDSFVEEGNLTYNISILRKALGERAGEHQYIVTVPGRGYRFVASVHELQAGPDQADSGGMIEENQVTFDKATGVSRATGWPFRIFLRRRKAVLLAVALLAVGLIALLVVLPILREPDISERTSVAVVDFMNETDEPDLNGLSGMLITSLEQSRHLSVLTRARMFDVLKQMGRENPDRIDESLGREICARANVTALVMASIRKFDQLYTIDLKVLDRQKNEYLFTRKQEGVGKASIPGMIDRLSEQTRVALRESAAEARRTSQSVKDVTTVHLDAYHHYFLGEQLINWLRFPEAEEELRKAIVLDSEFALAYYRLAYALSWHGAEEAKDPMRLALQYIEKTPEKERLLIQALGALTEGKQDEAIAGYKKVLESYPEEKEALWGVADRLFHKDELETAIIYMEKVLAVDPKFQQALQHIVWAYRELEQYDKMLESAKRYVTSVPPSEEAYLQLGSAYCYQADFAHALETYRRAGELFPASSESIARIGDVYVYREDYQQAESQFKKLIQDDRPLSDQRSGYRNLTSLYAYVGRFRESLKMCDAIVEIDKKLNDRADIARTYGDRAFWLAGSNNRIEAKRAIEVGLEFENAADLSFYLPLFFAYVMIEEYEKASSLANDRVFMVSPSGNALVKASVHRANGEYDEAISALQPVAQRGLVFFKMFAGYVMAQCYFEKGQFDEAIEAIRKAQRIYNHGQGIYYGGNRAAIYPKTFYLLGKIYEKKGDRESAIDNYRKFLDLWKDADKDLPELLDVKSRLSKLKGASGKHQRG